MLVWASRRRRITEGGFSYPPYQHNGQPASRRGWSAFAEGLPCFAMLRTAQRRDRQECPPSLINPCSSVSSVVNSSFLIPNS